MPSLSFCLLFGRPDSVRNNIRSQKYWPVHDRDTTLVTHLDNGGSGMVQVFEGASAESRKPLCEQAFVFVNPCSSMNRNSYSQMCICREELKQLGVNGAPQIEVRGMLLFSQWGMSSSLVFDPIWPPSKKDRITMSMLCDVFQAMERPPCIWLDPTNISANK
jgi:hypothetical protein